jgi:hypothetical protein
MMHVPTDETVIRDCRLTLLRVVSTLYERLVEADDGLKVQVKETMQRKGADFAESDLVIARLQNGGSFSWIDARKLHGMIGSKPGQITLDQFLSCISVGKQKLEKFLSKDAIAAITNKGSSAAAYKSLVTEFKPGVAVDVDELADALQHALQAAQAKPPICPISTDEPKAA